MRRRDLNAYASTLNYLEGMTLVRGVAVEQIAGDTLRFRLAVRGDATTLRRAIALDNQTRAADSDAPAPADERCRSAISPKEALIIRLPEIRRRPA